MTTSIRHSRQAFSLHADLLPHQREALSWLLGHEKTLLAHATGLGKTVEALAYIAALSARGELVPARSNRKSLARVLWITDATLLEQTRRSVERFLPDFTVEVGGPSGLKQHRRWADRYGLHGPDILILNYELANSRSQRLDTFTPALVVLDEVGKLRNGGAQWKTVKSLCQRAPRVVGMTASWLQNRPTDLHRILDAIGTPGLWPYRVFEERFCTMRYTHTDSFGRDHYAPDDWVDDEALLDEVRDYLAGCMHRLEVADAGLSLPEQTGEARRWVPLAESEQRAYDAAAEWRGLHGHQHREKAPKSAGADSALISALMDELASRGGEQAVVYCEALDMLELAAKRMTEARIPFASIEGKVKQADRTKAVDDFRDGKVRVLLGSKVLEHGLDLQHCRVLISVDSSWNPEREKQREGRLRRIGSPHSTFEHLTLLPDTPHSRRKLSAVDKKGRLADAILPRVP